MLLASDYDKSKYLKATDLEREKKFRIKSVTEEELGVGKDKEKKLVVWFTNDARGLVLNKTNNRALRSAFGDNTAGWTGKVIAVFPTQVDIRGKLGPALRVRILPPKQAAAAAPPTQPAAAPSGNGAAAAAPAPAAPPVDPELEPDPKFTLTAEQDDELNDEIPKW
jgi:hypothetical protein